MFTGKFNSQRYYRHIIGLLKIIAILNLVIAVVASAHVGIVTFSQ